jgi:hypothetical protein
MKAPTAGEPAKQELKRMIPLQFLLVFYLALWPSRHWIVQTVCWKTCCSLFPFVSSRC